MAYQSKTQIYLKVKKPLLERQRRARINQSLETLKKLVAELQADDAVLRMDKAELLEQTLVFVRKQSASQKKNNNKAHANERTCGTSIDYFRHGYMNAVNEVSRVMASTPGMNVEMGKCVMTHLGRYYNRLQKEKETPHNTQQLHQHQYAYKQHLTVEQQQQVSHKNQQSKYTQMLRIECGAPLSPASSGYHSDCESPAASPVAQEHKVEVNLWRPW